MELILVDSIVTIFCLIFVFPAKSPSDVSHGAAESLLPIVSSQRERFRIRNQELETVHYGFMSLISPDV